MMQPGGTPPWYRRLSLRLRMILATAVVVAAVLMIGGALILLAVRAELIDTANEVGKANAADVAEMAVAGTLPEPLPVMHDPEVAVQVVSAGRVLTHSVDVAGDLPFELPTERPGVSEVLKVDELPVAEAGPYRVTALGTVTPDGAATIYVAISMQDLDDIMETATAVGARRGRPVVLVVDSAAMSAGGHEFFQAANGVWLTLHVPSAFLGFPYGSPAPELAP